jgi:hypothetical protein
MRWRALALGARLPSELVSHIVTINDQPPEILVSTRLFRPRWRGQVIHCRGLSRLLYRSAIRVEMAVLVCVRFVRPSMAISVSRCALKR